MKAIIISIGDELTCGRIPDTNSAYLAERLVKMGIEVIEHLTVGDDREKIAEAIRLGVKSAQIVLVSGGIGPTGDDLPRHALADAMKKPLVCDEAHLAAMDEFFRKRGRKMSKENRIQAMIPDGAHSLENTLGTACGIAAKMGDSSVFVMPGVPHEMKKMFSGQVAPLLPNAGTVILHKSVHVLGIPESDLWRRISDLGEQGNLSKKISIGTIASAGMITVRITLRSRDAASADKQADAIVKQIRHRLGDSVVGEDTETLASAVGKLLRRNAATLATAESCTGGLIGQMITSVPGASDYYLGGVIAYSNQSKQRLLGVEQSTLDEHGVVSEQTAGQMATSCRESFSADWAISVTGIAGPTGASRDKGEKGEKPLGLVYIGLAGPNGTIVHRNIFTGPRQVVQMRAALAALNYLRLEVG